MLTKIVAILPKNVVKPNLLLYTILMQSKIKSWGPSVSIKVVRSGQRGAPFIPGLLLIALALVVIFSPKLFLGAIAIVVLCFGMLMCYVAWRIICFKKHVSQMTKDLERRFYAHSSNMEDPLDAFMEKPDIDITETDSKKIIYH